MSTNKTVAYQCPCCGAGLGFDPEKQKFACEFCLSEFDETELTNAGAAEAAERAANAYRAAGWEELPVSTRTFRLFARGARTAALLAEDAPSGGTRVTEFRRGDL